MSWLQSVEDIKKCIEDARKTGAGATGAVAGPETDEYIDDAMDNMYDESSLDYQDWTWGFHQQKIRAFPGLRCCMVT